ncbi:MAG: P-II family nitrogen regulator [Flavobacteriaceae bacterium]|nr:P-II family nitrogen regulator [Flavobacteriaceae bacterium]
MKKIEAIIRQSKFETVKKALHEVGVNFLSHWEVTGQGNEQQGKVYRGITFSTADIKREYISIVVNDDFEDITIKTLLESARTGDIGDGKIFVSEVSNAYRIRTGEQGGETLK